MLSAVRGDEKLVQGAPSECLPRAPTDSRIGTGGVCSKSSSQRTPPPPQQLFGSAAICWFLHVSANVVTDLIINLLSPGDPGTGALPQHLAGNSV